MDSATVAPETGSTLDAARRVYLYVIAAVGLFLLGIGLANLLELAFSRLGELWSDDALLVGGASGIRRQVSVHAAMVLVALPIWLAHWYLAERAAVRADGERRSTVRALYLALVLAIPLVYVVTSLRDLIYRLALEVTGVDGAVYGRRNVPEALALLAVAGGVWAYHVWARLRDERAGPLPSRAVWPPRLYLYAAAFAGAMLLVDGVVDLLGITVEALFDPGDAIVRADRWWAPQLAEGAGNSLAGLALWAAHWAFSLRRVRAEGWLGSSERRSVLRRVYLYLVAFTGAVLTLAMVVRILDALFQWAFGVYPSTADSLGQRLLESLLRILPFGVLWLYHRRQVVAEAAAFAEAPLQVGVRRVYTYGAALIGLAFAGLGLARLVSLSISALGSGEGQLASTGDAWRDDVSFFAAIALTGAAAWLWHWYRVQQWVERDPIEERGATTRRVYLYAALGASVVAVLGGLSVIVYRILSSILDVADRGDFIGNVSGPGGVALAALLIAAYHGLTLRADLAARPEAGPQAATVDLVLAGPPGADVDAVVDALRHHLPEGFSLRRG